eukprot:5612642-Amphidinium_carterae.1
MAFGHEIMETSVRIACSESAAPNKGRLAVTFLYTPQQMHVVVGSSMQQHILESLGRSCTREA